MRDFKEGKGVAKRMEQDMLPVSRITDYENLCPVARP